MATTTSGPPSLLERLLRRGPRELLTVRLRADASGAVAALERVGRELRAFSAAAQRASGGALLFARQHVDVHADLVEADEWMSPDCRGWLCSSCPGLACHHRCHPDGELR